MNDKQYTSERWQRWQSANRLRRLAMSNKTHAIQGVILFSLAAVCVAGLLALGLIALNAYSDSRHAAEIWASEHPQPTATPLALSGSDIPTTGDLVTLAVASLDNVRPFLFVTLAVAFAISVASALIKIVGSK